MSRAKRIECPQCRDTGGVVIGGLTVECGSNICQRSREERLARRVLHETQAWIAARDRRTRALGAPK